MRRPLTLAIVAAAVLAALLATVCTIAVVRASKNPDGQFYDALAHRDYLRAWVLVTLHPGVANCSRADFHSRSPLFWACWEGYSEDAGFLLRHGARVDYADHEGTTCLHAAAHSTFDPKAAAAIAEMLLRRGADPLAKDAQGRTPLSVAEEVGNSTVATLLREGHP